jgi:transcriptional regulator with XRE-family HTH domain
MAALEKSLGHVLADARRGANLSQEALAFKAKVHPTYVSQIERGLKSPTVRVLAAIARAVGRPASELLKEAEKAASQR